MEKKNKIIIAIIAVIVVITIAIGAVYATTDLFKSPKDLFYKYLAQNIESSNEFNYDEILNNYKSMREKSYTANGEVSIDIKSDDEDSQEIFDEVNKMKIKTEEKSIPKENKTYTNIKLDYDNSNLLEASLVKNNDVYGVKSDILYDKYITAENNNLKELAKKLGIDEDNIPDKFEEINTYELLYISKEDRNKIVETYKKVLDESFAKDKYTVEKNVETTVNGETVKANAYSIKINEKEALNACIKFLETLKNDDLTLDLVVEKVNMTNINSVMDEDEKLSKDKIKDEIEDAIEDLKDELEYASDDEVTIKVYASKGKTVKTEIVAEEDSISIEKYEKDNEKYVVIKEIEDGDEEFSITIKYNVKEENGTKIVSGNVTVKEKYSDEVGFDFEVSTKGKIGTGVNEVNASISFKADDNKMKLSIKQTVDYDANVEIEDLNDSNSVKINDMSEDEINDLATDISKNLQDKVKEKLEDDNLSDLVKLITGSNLPGTKSTYELDDYDTESDFEF